MNYINSFFQMLAGFCVAANFTLGFHLAFTYEQSALAFILIAVACLLGYYLYGDDDGGI